MSSSLRVNSNASGVSILRLEKEGTVPSLLDNSGSVRSHSSVSKTQEESDKVSKAPINAGIAEVFINVIPLSDDHST